jgi:hypothetical protein
MRSTGVELLHADRRPDMTKSTDAFRKSRTRLKPSNLIVAKYWITPPRPRPLFLRAQKTKQARNGECMTAKRGGTHGNH